MPGKQRRTANRIIYLLSLLALLGLALCLRLRFARTVHLYPDEFVSLLAIRMVRLTGLPVMPSGLFYEHGLLYTYLAALVSWPGTTYLPARLVSLGAGLLAIALTFALGRRWFSPAAALVAVAGLTIAPAAIEWSGRVRMYALLQLLVLATLWLAFEGLYRGDTRLRWAALLAYLAAALTHFVSVALAPPVFLALLAVYAVLPASSRPRLPRRRLVLEIAALGVILLVAFLVKRAGQPKGVAPMEATSAAAGVLEVLRIYSDLSFNLLAGWRAISPFYLTLPAVIFAPFAGLSFLLAVGRGVRRRPTPSDLRTLFLGLVLLTATLEMVLLVSPDRRDEKYLFMLLPMLFLLGAQGMMELVRRLPPERDSSFVACPRSVQRSGVRRSSFVVRRSSPAPGAYSGAGFVVSRSSPLPALLIAGLVLTAARGEVRARLANTGDDYASAFAYVQAHQQSGDKVMTGTPAAAAFYLGRSDFYCVQRRGGYDYRILTVNGQAVDRWLASPAIRTEEALHQTLAQNRVWLVLERWGLQREYYDPPFQQQLLAQTDLVYQSQGMFVLRSKENPRPLQPNPAYPREAVFGDRVRLLGYTLEPDAPAAGQTIRLTLYWQAVAPMGRDYTVFVHLRESGGGNVAQADHQPLAAVYPTSLWPVGETIREASHLALPPDLPPGTYELWTGLYLLDTGERLPVQNDTSGENAVLLGRLEIGD